MKITGFLYGHYDSRGGCTFVERATRQEADAEYVSSFMVEDWETENIALAKQAIIDEDYLGTATIESGPDIPNGTDIEYREDSLNLWVKEHTDPSGRFTERYELVVNMGSPGEGFSESELGEDAFGVLVIRAGHTTFGDKI